MQDIIVARLQITRVQTPSPPSLVWNVLRESLSVGSQNIPCATLKSWVISVYLWVKYFIFGLYGKCLRLLKQILQSKTHRRQRHRRRCDSPS